MPGANNSNPMEQYDGSAAYCGMAGGNESPATADDAEGLTAPKSPESMPMMGANASMQNMTKGNESGMVGSVDPNSSMQDTSGPH